MEEQTLKLARATMVRKPEPPNLFLQMLNPGQEITVKGNAPGSFLKVQWTRPDGTTVDGVALRSDLALIRCPGPRAREPGGGGRAAC
ncbi:MAG: hypothetical protein U1F77_08475 [Kiritimatiellia bacterium]